MCADGSVRFDIDEPARHQMIRTLGDLALLGEHGNSGIPCGHLVVYNASHALMHQFLRRVRECMSDGVAVPWPFMLLPQEIERLQAGETEEIAAVRTSLLMLRSKREDSAVQHADELSARACTSLQPRARAQATPWTWRSPRHL